MNDSKGFTLSELLLAFAILAFVLAGALSLFVTCIFLNEGSRNLGVATGHAQFILEDIKNTNFTSLKTGAINSNTYWDWNSAAITSKGLAALNTESINTHGAWADEIAKDRLEVIVTVTWKDRGLRDRSVYLETLVTQP